MAIKELISKTGRWFSVRNNPGYEPLRKKADSSVDVIGQEDSGVVTAMADVRDSREPVEMLQVGFDQLVEKLGGINENLSRQMAQNEELMNRIDELPSLLQNFPEALNNQRAITENLLEQLSLQSLRSAQFAESIEKIPAAAAEQTNAIVDMANQMAASASVEAQLNEGFNRFNSTVDKLKDNIEGQTDGILQMSRTFSASDRYLKYILSMQHKRFMWVFVASLGVCTFAICVLLIVIILLK